MIQFIRDLVALVKYSRKTYGSLRQIDAKLHTIQQLLEENRSVMTRIQRTVSSVEHEVTPSVRNIGV